MVIFDMRDVCQSITVRNPTNRHAYIDFETDDGRALRVVLKPNERRVIGIKTKKYVVATATPGVLMEGK